MEISTEQQQVKSPRGQLTGSQCRRTGIAYAVPTFVEVRTRSGRALGSPEESITSRKRARLVDTAQEYLQENHAEQRQWRIDLVAIEMRPDGRLDRLDVLQNAVEV